MSRMNAPSPMIGRPTNNVYTALAFISAVATIGALVYSIMRFMDLGVLQ